MNPVSTDKIVSAQQTIKPVTKQAPGKVRLPIKIHGERMDRIHDIAVKDKILSKKEISILDQVLLKSKVIKHVEKYDKFSKALQEELDKELVKKSETSRQPVLHEYITRKLLKGIKQYCFDPIAFGKVKTATTKSSLVLASDYSKGEKIPDYISTFDTTKPHTIPAAEYLNVRLAHATVDALKKSVSNDIFIGPPQDMINFYADKGYQCVGQLKSPTSTPFFYFENEKNPSDHLVVIGNISNQSRFNHQLLQLKFAGVDLSSIKVRGKFEVYLKANLDALNKALKELNPAPEVAFIGNRGEIMTQLATHVYPNLMKDVDKDKREQAAEDLLKSGHNFKTIEIGPFKFSYATATIEGRPIGVIGMRMPNGDLAGKATVGLLQAGVKELVMVGAGGSLAKSSPIGGYQIVTESTYLGQQILLEDAQLASVDIENCAIYPQAKNVTVDSPLVETEDWLKKAEKEKSSCVDVETYHILKAFEDNAKEGQTILPGIFNSDVVGEHPLVEKIESENAWVSLPIVIEGVFESVSLDQVVA